MEPGEACDENECLKEDSVEVELHLRKQ